MPGPLAGVKVVELASIGPIPFCGMVLSDMGCAVVRVDNTTGRAYENAKVKLIAGDVARVLPRPEPREMLQAMSMAGAKLGGVAAEQTFSEYHLYTVPGSVTLRDRESQTLVLLEPRGFGAEARTGGARHASGFGWWESLVPHLGRRPRSGISSRIGAFAQNSGPEWPMGRSCTAITRGRTVARRAICGRQPSFS